MTPFDSEAANGVRQTLFAQRRQRLEAVYRQCGGCKPAPTNSHPHRAFWGLVRMAVARCPTQLIQHTLHSLPISPAATLHPASTDRPHCRYRFWYAAWSMGLEHRGRGCISSAGISLRGDCRRTRQWRSVSSSGHPARHARSGVVFPLPRAPATTAPQPRRHGHPQHRVVPPVGPVLFTCDNSISFTPKRRACRPITTSRMMIKGGRDDIDGPRRPQRHQHRPMDFRCQLSSKSGQRLRADRRPQARQRERSRGGDHGRCWYRLTPAQGTCSSVEETQAVKPSHTVAGQ